jgi:hypothetical protein
VTPPPTDARRRRFPSGWCSERLPFSAGRWFPRPKSSRSDEQIGAGSSRARPFRCRLTLPFLFPFGCGALWTHAALRRFLLALAGFVAVSSALTGALHVRLLTNHRATVLQRRSADNRACLGSDWGEDDLGDVALTYKQMHDVPPAS